MNAKGLTIPTTFKAIDETTSVTKQMRKGLAGFAQEAETVAARSQRAFRKLTPVLGHATKQLLSYASAGAVLTGIGYSVKAVTDYEVAIQSLQAVTGVSGSEMVGFKNEIEEVAKTSRKSSIDVAKSFETIGSNMSEYLGDPKGLRQITEAGITLSKAARTELEPTLNDLTSIMNQFNIKAGEAAKAVNTLTAGEIVGSVRTSELAGYLQQFGGVASSNNVALSESVALVEAFGKQLPKEAIGTAARNLITFMSAAKGMDKKAISSMHKYGVDMDLLMDKHTSLGVKIKELSKIKGDAVAMERFFGRENIAAGSVIFQQLDTYNEYEKRIRSTNKAQEQAALNSNTLQNRLKELENTWITLITTSDSATGSLNITKNVVGFLTDHMGGLVEVGATVLTVFALWKIANISLAAVAAGTNIVLGLQSAVTGYSTYAIEENVVAMRAQSIALGIGATATEAWSIVTALATGNMAALNVVMIANPIGAVVTGIALLTVAIGGLVLMQRQLREEYEQELALRIKSHYDEESKTVEKLAQRYIQLGLSKEEALKKSVQFEHESITLAQIKNKSEIATLKDQLRAKQLTGPESMFGNTYMPGGGAIQDKILAKEKIGTQLAAESLGLTNYVISKTSPSKQANEKQDLSQSKFSMSDASAFFSGNSMPFSNEKVNSVEAQSSTHTNNANATITIKNDSASQVDLDTPGKSRSVMPQTSSTMNVNKR